MKAASIKECVLAMTTHIRDVCKDMPADKSVHLVYEACDRLEARYK